MKVQENVGRVDQILRYIIAGLILIAAYISGYWWLAIFSVFLVLTAIFRFCGFYKLFGISSCKFQEYKEKK